MNLPRNQTALLFVALTGLGLAGNYFSLTLFFSFDGGICGWFLLI